MFQASLFSYCMYTRKFYENYKMHYGLNKNNNKQTMLKLPYTIQNQPQSLFLNSMVSK